MAHATVCGIHDYDVMINTMRDAENSTDDTEQK